MGCAQPAGEQGYNLGRVVALLAELGDVPGTTVNRYCSSSLQTIRMAAHAIRLRRGRRVRRRGRRVREPVRQGPLRRRPGHHQRPVLRGPRPVARRAQEAGAPTWTPAEGLPDVYIAMGQTAENVVQQEGVTREEMDEFAALSQQRAVESQENGFFEREIIPVTLPDGTVDEQGRRPPARHDGREARAAQAGVPARRHGHRRQRVPAQRRRGRGRRDERHPGERARASRRSPASCRAGCRR